MTSKKLFDYTNDKDCELDADKVTFNSAMSWRVFSYAQDIALNNPLIVVLVKPRANITREGHESERCNAGAISKRVNSKAQNMIANSTGTQS